MLFKALAVFALRQINLTKVSSHFMPLCLLYPLSRSMTLYVVVQIESRPLRRRSLRVSDENNNGSPK